jgi:hypothetical protein
MNMKNLQKLALACLFVFSAAEISSAQKLPGLDPSPADIAILRTNGERGDMVMKVTYGRPQKKGRTMLGGIEPFGKVWRTGANESTEVKLYKDVTFGDKKVPAGTYTLYSIPQKDKWTIILNSKLDTWGAYEYDQSKDVARFDVPVSKPASEVEAFTIGLGGGNGSGNMALAWENTLVTIPLKF